MIEPEEPCAKRSRYTRVSESRPRLLTKATCSTSTTRMPSKLDTDEGFQNDSRPIVTQNDEGISDERPSQSDNTTHDIDNQVLRLSQVSIEENSDDVVDALEAECLKRPLLDGSFFVLHKEGSSIDNRILMKCKFCRPDKILKTTLRCTSNLTTHLHKRHPEEFKEYTTYSASRKSTPSSERKKWSCTFSQEKWESNCTAFVLDTMIPLHTVENESYRKIFDDLNIKKNGITIKHLTRHTLLKRITSLVEEQRTEIKKIVRKTKYVCTTADAWSGKKRRFLGVTLHWIDERTLERKSAAIACKRFPGTHSHDAIAGQLSDIHASFGIDLLKLVATVTDNASNFVKAFKEFGIDATKTKALDIPLGGETVEEGLDELSNEDSATIDEAFSEECETQLSQHLRCASHTLNLVATTDIFAISDSFELTTIHEKVMNKCNVLWKTLRSPKTSEAMRQYLGIALKRPVVTRWNSLFVCLTQLKDCKTKLLSRDGKDLAGITSIKNPLTSHEFLYIEEYLRCTCDLAGAIDLLQGETYCNYGYLLPTLVQLKYKLLSLKSNVQIKVCKPIIVATIAALEKRFAAMFDVTGAGEAAAIAAITHPTFKLRWLRCLPDSTQRRAYDLVVAAIAAASTDQEINANVEPPTPADEWDFGDAPMVFDNLQPTVNHATSEVTLSDYLHDQDRKLTMLRNHPVVRDVFIKYNTPLPSSAPVERLFSYATMFDLPRYNRLTDDHFELRVLAKVNASKKYI